MLERKRLALLIVILNLMSLTGVGITIGLLYDTAFKESRNRLSEIVLSQARLIESVTRFDRSHTREGHPGGAAAATLEQITDAHRQLQGISGKVGFTLVKRDGERVLVLLSHRHAGEAIPQAVSSTDPVAEPMLRALQGTRGTMIGPDFRGMRALSAYGPIAGTDLGIVAHMEMSEIRAPFYRAAGVALLAGFLVTLAGAVLCLKLVRPIIRRLEESEEFGRSIIRSSRDSIKILDLENRVRFMSEGGMQMLGIRDPGPYLGTPYLDFWQGADRQAAREALERARAGDSGSFQGYRPMLDGTPKWWDVVTTPIHRADGRVESVLAVSRDVTESRRTLDLLRQAREELEKRVEERTAEIRLVNERLLKEVEERKETERALRKTRDSLSEAQRVASLGNWDWNIVSNELAWSDEIYRIFGLAPQEFGATYEAFLRTVHPQDRELVTEAVNRALEGKDAYSIDHRIVLPDGTVRVVHEQAEVKFDPEGRAVRMLGTVQDISTRKKAEEALQRSEQELRVLSNRLLTAQEDERKRIARDLHDGVGQTLSAVKFRLETIIDSVEAAVPGGADGLRPLIPMIRQAIEEVRKTSQGLRPSILDDLGIRATIRWLCREFQSVYPGLEVRQEVEIEEEEVPESLKIAIYRILQEALNNTAKHSGACLVRVRLDRTGKDAVELTVEDNGAGFTPEEVFSPQNPDRGLGLHSMKDRTELSGGFFSLESAPGLGTTVRVHWPAGRAVLGT